MRINPMALGGKVRSYLLSLQFPNWSVRTGTFDFGIYWKDASDHTQVFGDADGFFFSQGFNYESIDLNSFQTQSGQAGVQGNGSDVYHFDLFSVNAAGADVANIGGSLGGLNTLRTFAEISFSASKGTTPWNGIRLQLTFTVGTGDSSISVPQKINCFGSP